VIARSSLPGAAVLLGLFLSPSAPAQTPTPEPAASPAPVVVETAEEAPEKMFDTRIYGYINSYYEKVSATPAGVDAEGNTFSESNTSEFDVLNFNVMVQGAVQSKYRYYLNLSAPGAGSNNDDEGLVVRNAWIETPLVGDKLSLRFGKMYRRFGLYSEVLDAVPQFNGIEVPEYLDKDHLFVTRTTSLMFHGRWTMGENAISYAAMTGNDERVTDDDIPIGLDARFHLGTLLTAGGSLYSTNGKAQPSRGFGEGSPRGGVINWMTEDEYIAYGAFAQVYLAGLTLEGEFFMANHDGTRDAAYLADPDFQASLNSGQADRFYNTTCVPNCAEGDVITSAKYDASTFYFGTGYEIPLGGKGAVTPYARVDFFSNPETINEKDFGGDNEAGLTDDGKFTKVTAGAIYRPIPATAFKVDFAAHSQKFNDETITYPEVRVSFSYLWGL